MRAGVAPAAGVTVTEGVFIALAYTQAHLMPGCVSVPARLLGNFLPLHLHSIQD